jgi:hypothetical protein
MANAIEIHDMSTKMFRTTVNHTQRCWNTCVFQCYARRTLNDKTDKILTAIIVLPSRPYTPSGVVAVVYVLRYVLMYVEPFNSLMYNTYFISCVCLLQYIGVVRQGEGRSADCVAFRYLHGGKRSGRCVCSSLHIPLSQGWPKGSPSRLNSFSSKI